MVVIDPFQYDWYDGYGDQDDGEKMVSQHLHPHHVSFVANGLKNDGKATRFVSQVEEKVNIILIYINCGSLILNISCF